MILPWVTPSGLSKKFFVSEYSNSEPMLCAPPPPIAMAHVLFVDGASPPNTLPIDPVNMACANAGTASVTKTATAASNNRVVRNTERPKSILTPERPGWRLAVGGLWCGDGRRVAFRSNHVIQLAPLRWRRATAIAAPPFTIVAAFGR